MSVLIFDIAILVILLLFAFRGARQGLILSLFSLVAVLVAFVGSVLVTNTLSPAASDWLQPHLRLTVTSAVLEAMPEGVTVDGLQENELLVILDQADLPLGLNGFVDDLMENGIPMLSTETLTSNLTTVLTEKLANLIVCVVLFIISFVLILTIWRLISRALDLVAKLPGLNALNTMGGLVFGIFCGAVILFVCAWVVRSTTLIPQATIDESHLLKFFMTINPLENLTNP